MIDFNYKRAFFSAAAGIGFGSVCEFVHDWWSSDEITGFLMLPIIAVASVVSWFILENNNDFKG